MSRRLLSVGMVSSVCIAAGCMREIPIQAVILEDDDGTNRCPITNAQIRTWVDAANTIYDDAQIRFVFDDSPGSADVIVYSDTKLNSVPPSGNETEENIYDLRANILAALSFPDKAVVLFRARGGGGWSWGPTKLMYVSMPAYTNTGINKPSPGSPNDTLLAHELGHYLGLTHTFAGFNCENSVPACNPCTLITLSNMNPDTGGQDDKTTLDDVSDTNPDPRADCAPTTSLSCPGGEITVNGIQWDPPWTNVMTYHDCLPEVLSEDQMRVIDYVLTHPWREPIVH